MGFLMTNFPAIMEIFMRQMEMRLALLMGVSVPKSW
jgi:hypothetical protein